MKKPEYINELLLTILFVVFLNGIYFVLGIHALICKEYVGGVVLLSLFAFVLSFTIFMWRELFSKLLINEEGITKYFGKKILKQIKWENIKEMQVVISRGYKSMSKAIFVSDEVQNEKAETSKKLKSIYNNMNQNIKIETRSKFCYYFSLYKDKFPVEIKDLNLLPEDIAEALRK